MSLKFKDKLEKARKRSLTAFAGFAVFMLTWYGLYAIDNFHIKNEFIKKHPHVDRKDVYIEVKLNSRGKLQRTVRVRGASGIEQRGNVYTPTPYKFYPENTHNK